MLNQVLTVAIQVSNMSLRWRSSNFMKPYNYTCYLVSMEGRALIVVTTEEMLISANL